MLAMASNIIIRGFVSALAAAFIFSAPLSAQEAPNPDVATFLANPKQFLQQNEKGGPAFIAAIRDVAVTHPDSLQTIIDLIADANSDQQSAIGSGLGQAYKLVLQTDQPYADKIAKAVAGAGSADAKTAYVAIVGDSLIGSIDGGAGGDGGTPAGSGGATNTGAGVSDRGTNTGSTTTEAQHFQTATQNYFTGGVASISGTTGTGTNTSTITTRVSPR
jgi:hypothetical protein